MYGAYPLFDFSVIVQNGPSNLQIPNPMFSRFANQSLGKASIPPLQGISKTNFGLTTSRSMASEDNAPCAGWTSGGYPTAP